MPETRLLFRSEFCINQLTREYSAIQVIQRLSSRAFCEKKRRLFCICHAQHNFKHTCFALLVFNSLKLCDEVTTQMQAT